MWEIDRYLWAQGMPVDSGCQSCSSVGENFKARAVQEDVQFQGTANDGRLQRATHSPLVEFFARLAKGLLPAVCLKFPSTCSSIAFRWLSITLQLHCILMASLVKPKPEEEAPSYLYQMQQTKRKMHGSLCHRSSAVV